MKRERGGAVGDEVRQTLKVLGKIWGFALGTMGSHWVVFILFCFS